MASASRMSTGVDFKLMHYLIFLIPTCVVIQRESDLNIESVRANSAFMPRALSIFPAHCWAGALFVWSFSTARVSEYSKEGPLPGARTLRPE